MERYRQSVPAFTYNAAVFPPYGDTIHHWYIGTPYKHVSLITDSKEENINYINNTFKFIYILYLFLTLNSSSTYYLNDTLYKTNYKSFELFRRD